MLLLLSLPLEVETAGDPGDRAVLEDAVRPPDVCGVLAIPPSSMLSIGLGGCEELSEESSGPVFLSSSHTHHGHKKYTTGAGYSVSSV